MKKAKMKKKKKNAQRETTLRPPAAALRDGGTPHSYTLCLRTLSTHPSFSTAVCSVDDQTVAGHYRAYDIGTHCSCYIRIVLLCFFSGFDFFEYQSCVLLHLVWPCANYRKLAVSTAAHVCHSSSKACSMPPVPSYSSTMRSNSSCSCTSSCGSSNLHLLF